MNMQAPLFELNKATVMRGGRVILHGITTKIALGENVAILGPNGSGKSTFIKLVTREFFPLALDEGAPLKILGEEFWDLFALRSLLGIVSSDLQDACAREVTAREMLLSGFFSSIGLFYNHRVTKEMETKVDELLSFLEIPHLAGKYMTEMSSGEARRVLIGRALVHDPKVLILDEPTNSLDLHAVHQFRAILRKIAAAGKSVILVTHHLHDIIPEISRVLMIRNGAILRDGPKAEILTDANLSELFSIPIVLGQKDGYYRVVG